jgi:hypothetical protein
MLVAAGMASAPYSSEERMGFGDWRTVYCNLPNKERIRDDRKT